MSNVIMHHGSRQHTEHFSEMAIIASQRSALASANAMAFRAIAAELYTDAMALPEQSEARFSALYHYRRARSYADDAAKIARFQNQVRADAIEQLLYGRSPAGHTFFTAQGDLIEVVAARA